MDIQRIKDAVLKKYTITENDESIPKFATRFTFFEDKIVVLIPMHEHPIFMDNFSSLMEAILRTSEPTPKRSSQDISELLKQLLLLCAMGKPTSPHGRLKGEAVLDKAMDNLTPCVIACRLTIGFDKQIRG